MGDSGLEKGRPFRAPDLGQERRHRWGAWWPTEKLIIFKTEERVEIPKSEPTAEAGEDWKPPELLIEGEILGLENQRLGTVTRIFSPKLPLGSTGPRDWLGLMDTPSAPLGPRDRPEGIPLVPLLGILETNCRFDSGLHFDLSSQVSGHLSDFGGGSYLFLCSISGSVSDAGETTEGVGKNPVGGSAFGQASTADDSSDFASVGVSSSIGKATFLVSELGTGHSVNFETLNAIRLTTDSSRQEIPRDSSASEAFPADDSISILAREISFLTSMDHGMLELETRAGFGLETNEVHASASGPFLIGKGQIFDLEGHTAEGWSTMALAGDIGGALGSGGSGRAAPRRGGSEPPAQQSGAQKAASDLMPFKVNFELNETMDLTLVGRAQSLVVPILDGKARLLMVAGHGLISRGSESIPAGVGAIQGATILSSDNRLVPGTQLPFRTFYQLGLLRIAAPSQRASDGTGKEGAEGLGGPSSAYVDGEEAELHRDMTRSKWAERRAIHPGPETRQDEKIYPPLGESQDLQLVDGFMERIATFLLKSQTSSTWAKTIVIDGKVVGFELYFPLTGFQVHGEAPNSRGMKALCVASGSKDGEAHLVLRFIPDDYSAQPGKMPPFVPFDPSREQRVVVLAGEISFADRETSGVRVFGTGRVFPQIKTASSRLSVGLTMLVMGGDGRLKGHAGMASGNLLVALPGSGEDSCGVFILRVADPEGVLMAPSVPELARGFVEPNPESSFLLMCGKNNESDPTQLALTPDGQMVGAFLRQQLSQFRTGFQLDSERALASASSMGPLIGDLKGDLFLNPALPPPVPFTSRGAHFSLRNFNGEVVGSFVADIVEGRGYPTQSPGLPFPIQRGAALAPILLGKGIFEGVEGLVTVVNWISIFPRQVSGLFLIRLIDPEGRFRIRRGEGNQPEISTLGVAAHE